MSFIDDLFNEIAYIAASGMADVRFFGQDENGGESDGFVIIITPIARPFNSSAFADAMKDETLFPANDNRFELIPPDNDHRLDRIQAVEEFLRETYEQRVREERPWRHATKTDRSRRDVAMEAYRANHTHFFAVSKQGPRPRSSRNPRVRT